MPQTDLDAYLTFSDDHPKYPITGETQDAFEKGFTSIQVRSYEFGFDVESHPDGIKLQDNDGDTEVAYQYPQYRDATFDRVMDKASPKLFAAMHAGIEYEYVALWQKRSGGTRKGTGEYFLKIWFHDVVIKNVKWSASADDPFPKEQLTLSFRGYTMEYYPQLPTGSLDTANKSVCPTLWQKVVVTDDADGDKGKSGKGAALDSKDMDKIDRLVEEKVTKILRASGIKTAKVH